MFYETCTHDATKPSESSNTTEKFPFMSYLSVSEKFANNLTDYILQKNRSTICTSKSVR